MFIFSLTEQDFPVVLLICFPITDKFNDMTHTKNIPSCCDVNNFAPGILLQLWSLKSDYQISEPHKWHSWSSVCAWNVNVQGIKWRLIWSTLFPLTKTQKRNWANTHYQAIITSCLVNNTYIWQNYEQYVRPLSKEIKKWWNLARSICIKEQAPLLNSTFRQTLIFL